MGRRRRLPRLDAYAGSRAEDVVQFLERQGFESRILARGAVP
jgi:hypothetical protein